MRCPRQSWARRKWEFAYSTYAFLDKDRIAFLAHQGGTAQLHIWDRRRATVRPLELPYSSIKLYLAAHPSGVAMIGASPAQMPAVVVVDIDSGESRELSPAVGVEPTSQAPDPEILAALARDGGRVYATLHRPRRDTGPAPVPVIVHAHPGPTSNAALRLDPWVQFFLR